MNTVEKLNDWLARRTYGNYRPVRKALVAMVDTTIAAPAQYDFTTDHIRINTDMTGTLDRTLLGFLAHEVGHAMWSTWKADLLTHIKTHPMTKLELEVISIFDEIRIERRAFDGGAECLRASFAKGLSLMLDGGIPTDDVGLSRMWVLCYGRYLASIASADEVASVHAVAKITFGDDTVGLMIDILSEAVATDTVAKLHLLATEWVELLFSGEGEGSDEGDEMITAEEAEGGCSHGEAPTAEDESTEGECDGDAEGDTDDKGDDAPHQTKADTTRTVADPDAMVDLAAIDTIEDEAPLDPDARGINDYAETTEVLERAVAAMAKALRETKDYPPVARCDMADPTEWARKIFKPFKKEPPYHEVAVPAATAALAAMVSRQFEAIVMPQITRTTSPSKVPPGRLRGREMVRGSAERAQGAMTTAEPWKHSRRQRTHARPVVVGIMTDVSGSMGWAQDFVAEFTYIVGLAGTRIGARVAAVTFGSCVINTLMPGETPHNLRVVSAIDGAEMCDEGMAALDGVLNLSYKDNKAKLLFIVSDGGLVLAGQTAKTVQRIEELQAAGTTVVWLGNQAGAIARVPGIIHIKNPRGNKREVFKQMTEAIITSMRVLR